MLQQPNLEPIDPEDSLPTGHWRILPLPNPFRPAPILFRSKTESTMDDAREAMLSGQTVSGTVFWAGEQTKGRGRIPGRTWIAAANESLLFTICLKISTPGDGAARLSLLSALAVARTIEEAFGLRPSIKWPNDVLIDGGKICGILGEATYSGHGDSWVGLGFGLNLSQTFFQGLLNASSIRQGLAKKNKCPVGTIPPPNAEACLKLILEMLYYEFTDVTWLAALNFRLHGRGETARVHEGRRTGSDQIVTILNVNPDGSLRVRNAAGEEQNLISGDISIIPESDNID